MDATVDPEDRAIGPVDGPFGHKDTPLGPMDGPVAEEDVDLVGGDGTTAGRLNPQPSVTSGSGTRGGSGGG